MYCTISPLAGQAGKYSAVEDADTDILVVHPGTGSRDAAHWNMLHDPDRYLQDVQTATVEESQLRGGHGNSVSPIFCQLFLRRYKHVMI